MKKLRFAALLCAATFTPMAHGANADTFPDRPITLVVPYAAGGLTDVVIRKMVEHIEKPLGQTVVIQNKGGANGTLGAASLQSAKPDGYTLAIVPGGVFRIPYIQKVEFDPVADLTYVSGIADYSYLIAARGDSPWKSLKDLLAAAKKEPGRYTYGSPGIYSTPQMAMDDVVAAAGGEMMHVPYKGGSDNVTALLGGQVDIIVGGGSGMLAQLVQDGKIRILATMNGKRGSDYPSVPTVRESGFDIEARSPMGVVGPKGMDAAIVKKLDAAFKQALAHPEYIKFMQSVGMPITYMGPQEYTEYARATFKEEGVRMERVLALSGKKPARSVQ